MSQLGRSAPDTVNRSAMTYERNLYAKLQPCVVHNTNVALLNLSNMNFCVIVPSTCLDFEFYHKFWTKLYFEILTTYYRRARDSVLIMAFEHATRQI